VAACPAPFKYRPVGFMSQLLNLPMPQYLRTLTLDSVKLTEAEVLPIYQFSGLVSLQLVVVRGRAFQNLSRLVSLRSLTTWNCEWVNSDVLMHIGRLEHLEHLTLNCCDQINDEGLRHLSSLTNLQSLGLTDLTVISEVGLRHLSTLTNLEAITLGYTPVTDEMVRAIAEHHAEKLQVLDLDASSLGEGFMTDAGLSFLGKLTKLRRLKLGYHSFTPLGLASLSALTGLESLSLESVEGGVTASSLNALSRLVHLRKLNLDSCYTFDDEAMSQLKHFTELEHLNIAKTMFRRGLAHLSSKTHPKLTYLDMSYSEKLDDVGLKHITQLENLRTLHLFRCPKGHLTHRGTRALLALPNLDLLDCRECPIAKDVVKVLRSRIKDIREDLDISAINVHSNIEDGKAVAEPLESEEFPDSDQEGADEHQSLETMRETAQSNNDKTAKYEDENFGPPSDDDNDDDGDNDYEGGGGGGGEEEEEEDVVDDSVVGMMMDEVEGRAEAYDRNLLAALLSRRSTTNKTPPNLASSNAINIATVATEAIGAIASVTSTSTTASTPIDDIIAANGSSREAGETTESKETRTNDEKPTCTSNDNLDYYDIDQFEMDEILD